MLLLVIQILLISEADYYTVTKFSFGHEDRRSVSGNRVLFGFIIVVFVVAVVVGGGDCSDG